jgi:hypothetical protein
MQGDVPERSKQRKAVFEAQEKLGFFETEFVNPNARTLPSR